MQSQTLIIGAGLVGLTSTVALSKLATSKGGKITLCAPNLSKLAANATIQDGRSTALLANSVDFLKSLDLWQDLEDKAFPLRTMRIIDGTNRLIRAPQTDFNSREIGLEAFGYNVLNSDLVELLVRKLSQDNNIELLDDAVSDIKIEPNSATVSFQNSNSKKFDLIAACDGRNSIVRKLLNLEFELEQYPQIALVGNLDHSLPHHDISTEFHTETGPFTLVPLGQNKSSFVCVENAEGADQLTALSTKQLNQELERRSHSILGKINVTTKLQQFPLSISKTKIFSNSNIVFLGEAAHVLPPIGAQGFNIGIRDISQLKMLIENDPKSPQEIAQKYQENRSQDIVTRMRSVDLLNRSLLSDLLPSQLARSLGLYALSSFNPLRHFAMKEGVEPGKGFSDLAKTILPKRN